MKKILVGVSSLCSLPVVQFFNLVARGKILVGVSSLCSLPVVQFFNLVARGCLVICMGVPMHEIHANFGEVEPSSN